MLYVLRFILFWAGQCSCVPISLEKQYDSWCHIYGKMSDFAMLHPNIMSIHPRHILKNPLELEKTVNTACRSEAFLLSERPRTPMIDKYKRKGKTRNKRKVNEADRKPKSKDTNEAIKSHQQQQESRQKSIEM
ncbi:hypothetical protein OESDEN_09618 [Oesophagostomum dentatum]|uniref:Uncharacterized protein n=1 Tax=Oesophagostomum dentatum TaxID=61180 RepID=A0A0B1SZW9_OESDE|nr:hypothetical protein OESDEN_09618 [Oesophagostomum dentatum]